MNAEEFCGLTEEEQLERFTAEESTLTFDQLLTYAGLRSGIMVAEAAEDTLKQYVDILNSKEFTYEEKLAVMKHGTFEELTTARQQAHSIVKQMSEQEKKTQEEPSRKSLKPLAREFQLENDYSGIDYMNTNNVGELFNSHVDFIDEEVTELVEEMEATEVPAKEQAIKDEEGSISTTTEFD